MQARGQLGLAVGSLYPQQQQLDASLTYARPSERSSSSPQPGTGRQPYGLWQDSAGLSAAWEIDFWGKYRSNIDAAEASLQSTVADYDSGLVSLFSDVASSYVLVRTFEQRLAIAQNNLNLQREGLRIAEVRFDLGVTGERDVMQARALLDTTQAGIADLAASLRQSKHALSLLLSQTPSELTEYLDGAGPVPVVPRQVAVGMPADLMRRRPDIRSAEYAAAAQCARVGVAEAQLYPSFSLFGSVGYLSTTVGAFKLEDIFSQRAFQASFGPSLTLPLFNYGQLTNVVRTQDALFQQSLVNYQATVLAALREVEDGLAAFQRAQDRAASLATAADAARRSAELAAIQYREGQTDFTTVLVAQQNLLSVQDNLAAAQGSIALNLVSLYRALGGGWEVREGRDFVDPETKTEMAKRTNWGDLLKERPEHLVEPEQRPGRFTPDW
jgi:NodT family efflux transporter outer membrane factor (OMF) lipoprotein